MSDNPMVEKSLSKRIRDKIKKNEEEVATSRYKPITTELIGMNNAIPICATACACCWDKPIPEGFDDMSEYVAKRSKIGHSSVLEHSNHVIYMNLDNAYEEELIEFLNSCHFLHTWARRSINGMSWHLIIGGSYRGFCDLYLEAMDLNNPILMAITTNLYTFANSAGFEEVCKLGLLDKKKFLDVEPDENFKLLSDDLSEDEYDDTLFEVVGLDSVNKLVTNLYKVSPEAAQLIDVFDLTKFVTVTILFKGMSRIITQQLVRHRNAITQESQRYVDYSGAVFNSPALFKPGKYDENHKYKIRFGPSSQLNMTLSEIGEAICNIYSMLYNPAVNGSNSLLKEDARAYLPCNAVSNKIYVTFTYRNLFKFLILREDKAAQAEIRMYANAIGTWFRNKTKFNSLEVMQTYVSARLIAFTDNPFLFIDEVQEEVEETIPVTEEDYYKAAGLMEEGEKKE